MNKRGELEIDSRHIAALLAWGLVIVLLLAGVGSNLSLRAPLLVPLVLIVAFAFLSGISGLWSGSAERSINELNRVLAYLGFFTATLLVTQTSKNRQGFAQGIAAACGAVALLALTSRLLPGVLTIVDEGGNRLSYPLIYFNATGMLLSAGILLGLWMTRRGSGAALRWGAAGLLPAMVLALYLTLSRGGIAVGIIGAIALLFLSRHRLLYLATLLVTLASAAPAILVVRGSQDLSDGIRNQAAQDQGLTVLLVLLAGTAFALIGHWVLQQVRAKPGQAARRAVAFSLNRTVLRVVAAALGVALVIGVGVFGERAWDSFSNNEITTAVQGSDRLTQLSGTGRSDFWRVAIDSFEEKPIAGNGAGTFQFTWREERSIPNEVRDAHSLYLEAFSELGLLGGLTILALMAAFMTWGFLAWKRAEGEERERAAALFAVLLASVVLFAIDWSWEMPAVGAVLFLTGGVLMNVRLTQLTEPVPVQSNGHEQAGGRRFALAITGLAVAWVSMAFLAAPLWGQRQINQSQDAAADGDIGTAIERAQSARSIEPWAASPYLQLALLAQLQGDLPSAINLLGEAIDREDRNWQLYNLRAQMETELGDTASAERDFARARELNPIIFEAAAGAG